MTEELESRNVTARSALVPILIFAAAKVLFHFLTNDGYGFHRDELATIDDAKHLAWGYVAYPPVTPFFGRVAMLFGDVTPSTLRFLPSVAQSIVIVLAALITRRFGGGRRAQWIAALATAIAPLSLAASALYQYVAFDFLWWVLIAYFVVRLAAARDPRWWVPAGIAIGLGVMTKYTILFYVAGIVAGFLLTDLRRHLRSGWLWAGVALSLLIVVPHLVWQMQHDFITLDFLDHIRARDVRIGRTDGFIRDQFLVAANPITAPLWITGIVSLFLASRFAKFRIVAWMALVPFVLFVLARGRGYYLAPVYPMLFAAGATMLIRWLDARGPVLRRTAFAVVIVLLLIGSGAAVVALPIAPIGSELFEIATRNNSDLKEEIGWPELVAEVARIHQSLPAEERVQTGIFCSNYGEAGAVNLYGPAHGLPPAISNINSYWLRGPGPNPPPNVIVLGASREDLEPFFESVTVAGRTPVVAGVENEETRDHPDIYLCRGLRQPWEKVWPSIRSFG